MSRLRSLGLTGLLLPLGAVIAITGSPLVAEVPLTQTVPMQVTSDTVEYCQQLLGRVSDLQRLASAPVPHEVVDLTAEGQRMCDHGQTRGGIMRLRSALMLMEKDNGSAYR